MAPRDQVSNYPSTDQGQANKKQAAETTIMYDNLMPKSIK
jgi:hypothetical protein